MENHLSHLLFLQSLEISQVFIKVVGKGKLLSAAQEYCSLLHVAGVSL